ncbi:ChaB family protein [filamentous cyanobacterium LEGE 11480]|uniref:ChaB family protein n=1 Tax=Romeriopsis navalis LEGE 11480 TaxID=2777977 RepID=A0A928VSP6_9CYAN|nr:ChaB family protein [Romeriopsis navalis]MBE9031389.1 ChaB family protein [Romeriopsis navalis LEGE 11480]
MISTPIKAPEKIQTARTIDRTISAVYKTQDEVQTVIDRLKHRGMPVEHISVLGRDFSTDTRVAGFITKKDVILGGLKQGAIFGSLFGSVLSLLTGVGVLFIPFVGPVMAAGPLGTALIGAASGALAGSAGAGLASLLATLGMPEEKAAIYQTKVTAGEYLVMAEVPTEQTGEYQLLMESAGGQEIHVTDATLPRPCDGECKGPEDLSPEVRSHLSPTAQQDFIETYNQVLQASSDADQAEHAAWDMIRSKYQETASGIWS